MADLDELVDRAIGAVSALARRGSTLTTGVALVAAAIVGTAYLVGLAAFGGGTRTVWAVIGAALLIVAVGAPLVATFRLRSIPRRARTLADELRTLIRRDDQAKRVVIEAVEAEPVPPFPTAGALEAGLGAGLGAGGNRWNRNPPVVLQFQRFSSLPGINDSPDTKNLASVAHTIVSLPKLLSLGLLLTVLGGFLGFLFTLIWIF